MTFLKRIRNWYEEVTWKKITRQYCDKLSGAKMGLGESVTPRQDDPSNHLAKK